MSRPCANTKVRITKCNNTDLFPVGSMAYVAEYSDDNPEGPLVINKEPGQYHGQFVSYLGIEFEIANPFDLSDEQVNEIVKAALTAAGQRGYCDETENILRDLGLPTKVR